MAIFDDWWKDIKGKANEAQESIKDTAGKIQCRLGFHDGYWEYLNSDKCEQKKDCVRKHCRDVSYRTLHAEWSSWAYFKPESCLQERYCKRCNHREERTHHFSWTAWEYVEKKNCLQLRKCTRCSERDTKMAHNYNKKYYPYTGYCDVHEMCERCDSTRDTYLKSHQWVVIKHPSIPNK